MSPWTLRDPDFGQPDYNYSSPEELSRAVAEYPGRFSDDTHKLVAGFALDNFDAHKE